MTEHVYYKCDICEITAERLTQSTLKDHLARFLDSLFEDKKIRHVCTECTNELIKSTRKTAKSRLDANKSEWG